MTPEHSSTGIRPSATAGCIAFPMWKLRCWAAIGVSARVFSVMPACSPLANSSSNQLSRVMADRLPRSSRYPLTSSGPMARRACSESSSRFWVVVALAAEQVTPELSQAVLVVAVTVRLQTQLTVLMQLFTVLVAVAVQRQTAAQAHKA